MLVGPGSNLAIAPNLLRLRSGLPRGAVETARVLSSDREKVIFNPRDPNSLAQGDAPAAMMRTGELPAACGRRSATKSGLPMGAANELRARIGFVQTQEDYPDLDPGGVLCRLRRPASVHRRPPFSFAIRSTSAGGVEAGFGFRKSSTHDAGMSTPSNVSSVDWFLNPIARVELSGFAFSGRAIPPLRPPPGLRHGRPSRPQRRSAPV